MIHKIQFSIEIDSQDPEKYLNLLQLYNLGRNGITSYYHLVLGNRKRWKIMCCLYEFLPELSVNPYNPGGFFIILDILGHQHIYAI